jgi:hypothetical protein
LVTCAGGDQINLGLKYQSEQLLLGFGWYCAVNTISTYNINYINTMTIGVEQHQGREFIAIGALENGAFCTVFSENFHKF